MSAPSQDSIPLTPLPSLWNVQQVHMADGSNMILVQIQTPSGVFATFLDAAAAAKVGADIAKHGKQALTGLILPPGSLGVN